MIARAVVVALVALLLPACGRFSTGEGDPPADVSVGGDVSIRESSPATVLPAEVPPPDGQPEPVGAVSAEPLPSEGGPPVTNEHGDRLLNVTEVDNNGFHLRFTIDGELAYHEGSEILFVLAVRNDAATPARYDPDARGAVIVRDRDGGAVWSSPGCLPDFGDSNFDTGAPEMATGEEVELRWEYIPDERERDQPGCWIPRGRWEVFARFPWCPPENVRQDPSGNHYCADDGIRWVEGKPLAIEVR